MATISFNQHFPGYEILGELGRGNARVLKARNQFTGELVAIKHFAINTDAETIRRFQRESEIMTAIKHPNIVKIKEVRLEADLPYIVMELIEGGDLRSLLKESGHLDAATTIRLGLQLSQAFKAIHDAGIIHRDIKPENIMYRRLASDEFHFLLTDFGIAKLREQSHTVTGTSMMTYEYASPEQFDNPRGVTAATDFYSMGVVLYEALSGSVPFVFGEDGLYKFTQKLVHSLPAPLKLPTNEFLSPQLNLLIKGLLAKSPEERIKDPAIVRRMLKLAETEEPGDKPLAVTPAVVDRYSPATEESKKTKPYPVQPAVAPKKITEYKQPPRKKDNQATVIIISIVILTAIVMTILMIRESKKNSDRDNSYPADSTALSPSDSIGTTSTDSNITGSFTDSIASLATSDSSTLQFPSGKYVGQVYNSTMNGKGTFTWDNGDKYSGSWVNGNRAGYGIYYFADGERYDGEWEDSKMSGKGIYYYANGEKKYEGDFAYDKYHGIGTAYYRDGDRYTGRWDNGVKSGRGIYYYTSGKYDGQWENDKRNGYGVFNASGDNYINNCLNCKNYMGMWKDGLKEGFGRCYDVNNKLLYEGQFENDKPVDEYPNRGDN